MANKSIYVTMPTLAPLEEVTQLMQGIWERGIMTHNGPLVQRFEKEVADYLHLRNIVSVTNGTIAIHMAIRALGLKGEIITTPFTFIATISSIIWEGCTPVFVDIDPETLNMDPSKIEENIKFRLWLMMMCLLQRKLMPMVCISDKAIPLMKKQERFLDLIRL